jgi:uncharacterized protein (DUF433 family)
MLCVLGITTASWAAITVTPGSDSTKTVIRGTLVTPDQVLDGMRSRSSSKDRSNVNAWIGAT